MNCEQVKNRLQESSAGNLPADLEAHLTECVSCSEEAEALTKSSAWLALLQQEPPQLSAGFWVRYWESRGRVPDFWTTLTVLAQRLSIGLAFALVALLFGLQFFASPQEPTVAELDQPVPYWTASDADSNGSVSGREQVVLTLVGRTE